MFSVARRRDAACKFQTQFVQWIPGAQHPRAQRSIRAMVLVQYRKPCEALQQDAEPRGAALSREPAPGTLSSTGGLLCATRPAPPAANATGNANPSPDRRCLNPMPPATIQLVTSIRLHFRHCALHHAQFSFPRWDQMSQPRRQYFNAGSAAMAEVFRRRGRSAVRAQRAFA